MVRLERWVSRPVEVWRDWRRLDEAATPAAGEVGLLLEGVRGGSPGTTWGRVVIGGVVGWLPLGWVRSADP